MDDFDAPRRLESAPARSSVSSDSPGTTDNATSAPATSDSASEATASRASEASERAVDALPPASVRAERAPTAAPAPDPSSLAVAPPAQPSLDLTPHEQQLLNKMAKDAREYVTARFTENKQLAAENKAVKAQMEQYHKNVLPASYYQNPDAYILSPEYKEAATDLQYASYEEQHWTTQAQRIRAGESEVYDLAYDKNGQPQLTKVAVDANNAPYLEVQLQKNLAAAMQARQQVTHKVNEIRTGYTQRFTQANENLSKLNEQYFKAYMDPKSPRTADINNFKQFLPAEFREHPLTQPLAYSYAMVLDLTAKIKQLEAAASTKAANAADAARATPVVASAAASSVSSAASKLSMADFND